MAKKPKKPTRTTLDTPNLVEEPQTETDDMGTLGPTVLAAVPPRSTVDEVLDLMEQLERKKHEAIEELLQQRKDIDEKLERLGYDRTPAYAKPVGAFVPSVVRSRQPRSTDPNRPCKVCGQTGHDARRHRYEKSTEVTNAPSAVGAGDAP